LRIDANVVAARLVGWAHDFADTCVALLTRAASGHAVSAMHRIVARRDTFVAAQRQPGAAAELALACRACRGRICRRRAGVVACAAVIGAGRQVHAGAVAIGGVSAVQLTRAALAHLAAWAGFPALAAIPSVGRDIDACAAASHVAGVAFEAAFAVFAARCALGISGANVAALPAVGDVRGEAQALPAALRESRVALEAARAVTRRLRPVGCRAAHTALAAIAEVLLGVDAVLAAEELPCGAVSLALACRADLIGAALVPASAAVGGVAQRVDAGAAARRVARVAVRLTLTLRAFGGAVRRVIANVSAATAISRVARDVDAQITTAGVAWVAGEQALRVFANRCAVVRRGTGFPASTAIPSVAAGIHAGGAAIAGARRTGGLTATVRADLASAASVAAPAAVFGVVFEIRTGAAAIRVRGAAGLRAAAVFAAGDRARNSGALVTAAPAIRRVRTHVEAILAALEETVGAYEAALAIGADHLCTCRRRARRLASAAMSRVSIELHTLALAYGLAFAACPGRSSAGILTGTRVAGHIAALVGAHAGAASAYVAG